MNSKKLILAALISCACAGSAFAAGSDSDYKARKDRVESDYKMAKDKCDALKSNAKDICVAQAKGAQDVAKAEWERDQDPTPKNRERVAMAKADADYAVAKEKCDDLSGNGKDVCVKDAQAAHVKAKGAADVNRAANDTRQNKDDKVGQASQKAAENNRDADYKAAKERCDAMSGQAKDSCVKDVKSKYEMVK